MKILQPDGRGYRGSSGEDRDRRIMACDLSIPYQGETITISRASSPQPLQPGQQVIIEAVEGLALRVSPATDRRR
jgi:hypothetical protein